MSIYIYICVYIYIHTQICVCVLQRILSLLSCHPCLHLQVDDIFCIRRCAITYFDLDMCRVHINMRQNLYIRIHYVYIYPTLYHVYIQNMYMVYIWYSLIAGMTTYQHTLVHIYQSSDDLYIPHSVKTKPTRNMKE